MPPLILRCGDCARGSVDGAPVGLRPSSSRVSLGERARSRRAGLSRGYGGWGYGSLQSHRLDLQAYRIPYIDRFPLQTVLRRPRPHRRSCSSCSSRAGRRSRTTTRRRRTSSRLWTGYGTGNYGREYCSGHGNTVDRAR